jgi:thiamine biosynthesis lipoprotein
MKYIYLCLIFSYLSVAQETQTRTQAMMGTFVTLTLPTEFIPKTFEQIKVLESVLSSYDSKALVYILNHHHKVISHKYLLEALLLSKRYYHETDGYFDITIGAISKDLYHFGEENETIPSLLSMQEASLNIKGIYLYDKMIITDKNISIDLGGMGKGYIVDKISLWLNEQNISQGVIALSGDIRCLDLCDFDLQSPYSEESFAKLQSKVPNLSISTSGTYRRYIKNKKNHHLLNPKIASQGQDFISVSLFSLANNSQIDAYATAISVMPKAKAYAFLEAHSEIGFILVESGGKVVLGNYENLIEVLDIRKGENKHD